MATRGKRKALGLAADGPTNVIAGRRRFKADEASFSSCAARLLEIEDLLAWGAVKANWSYKQKSWVGRVQLFVEECNSAEAVPLEPDLGRLPMAQLKGLTYDLQGAVRPDAIAKWFPAAVDKWVQRLRDSLTAAELEPVIEALAAACAHGEAPGWLATASIDSSLRGSIVKSEVKEEVKSDGDRQTSDAHSSQPVPPPRAPSSRRASQKPRRKSAVKREEKVEDEDEDEEEVPCDVVSDEGEVAAAAFGGDPMVAEAQAEEDGEDVEEEVEEVDEADDVEETEGHGTAANAAAGPACPECGSQCTAGDEYCSCGCRVQRLGSRRVRAGSGGGSGRSRASLAGMDADDSSSDESHDDVGDEEDDEEDEDDEENDDEDDDLNGDEDEDEEILRRRQRGVSQRQQQRAVGSSRAAASRAAFSTAAPAAPPSVLAAPWLHGEGSDDDEGGRADTCSSAAGGGASNSGGGASGSGGGASNGGASGGVDVAAASAESMFAVSDQRAKEQEEARASLTLEQVSVRAHRSLLFAFASTPIPACPAKAIASLMPARPRVCVRTCPPPAAIAHEAGSCRLQRVPQGGTHLDWSRLRPRRTEPGEGRAGTGAAPRAIPCLQGPSEAGCRARGFAGEAQRRPRGDGLGGGAPGSGMWAVA